MDEQIFWFDGKETPNQRGVTLRIKADELSIGIVVGEEDELSCPLGAEQVAKLCTVMSEWLTAHNQADLLRRAAGL